MTESETDIYETHFHIHYCKSHSQRISKQITFNFIDSPLTIPIIKSLITNYFPIDIKKISLYDWKGLLIRENDDLLKLTEPQQYKHNIFITNISETLDSSHVLSLFILDKQLGEGGFGKVFLATNKYEPSEQFAIKFLNKDNNNYMGNLYKEINVLTSLEHKHVIKFLNFCNTNDDRIALIMEYASGGTLHDYIKMKGKLNENEARRIFIQILHTMKYIHNKSIIHRDLKPENILFADDKYNEIKIIDFGISTNITNNNCKCVGTLPYIAPEILEGLYREGTSSVDVWAMGCILFEMVTGDAIYKGTKDQMKEKMINQVQLKYPSYLSIEIVHLINLLCTFNPLNRITLPEILKHPWIHNESLIDEQEIENTRQLLLYYNDEMNINMNIKRTSTSVQRKTINKLNTGTFTKPKKKCCSNIKLKIININTSLNKDDNTIIQGRTLTNPSVENKQSSIKKQSKLLLTKLPNDFTDCDLVINYNRYFNNVPSYLEPIGHTKTIKKFKNQYKSFLKMVNPPEQKNCKNINQQHSFYIGNRNTCRQKTLKLPSVKTRNNTSKKIFSISNWTESKGDVSPVKRGVLKRKTYKAKLSYFASKPMLTEY